MPTTIEQEFEELDAHRRWQPLYLEIRNESHDYPHRVAKFPENRNRNRYRDVSPYDHSRVKLQNAENDYINASLIDIEEAQRSYILTQGPLPNTCCHFWLMVWQQKTKAVVMLNRTVEKESVKCAQYWPTDDQEMLFKETGFSVKLLSEDVKSYYTVHLLQLENINSGETRTISHFHYTTWPDFGVPESPASFLNFLFKVRESGSLNPDHGPAVIHCSAGIGRSGTFSLVDTCLVLMEKGDDINIKQVLLNMRKYRMGLIQTPDQLRFSYMAIIEGAKCIKGDSSIQVGDDTLFHRRNRNFSHLGLNPALCCHLLLKSRPARGMLEDVSSMESGLPSCLELLVYLVGTTKLKSFGILRTCLEISLMVLP
uniref:protein-tyrosine-phosphatase n=1 Tax=Callithrix jacchus TaxID=9483 RepID=A0A2R8MDW5_CALJA